MTDLNARHAWVALTGMAALAIGLVLLSVLLPASPAHAQTTFTVNSTADIIDADPGDGICAAPLAIAAQFPGPSFGPCTLRAATMEANAASGAVLIVVPAGTYTITIPNAPSTLEGEAAVGSFDLGLDTVPLTTNEITLRGAGARATIIDGAGIDRVLNIQGEGAAHVSDVTITRGSGSGGGIKVNSESSLTLTRSRILANTAITSVGGGINNSGTLVVTDTTIALNKAGRGAGLFVSQGTVRLTNTTISGNASSGPGAGIALLGGSVTLSHVTIARNTALTGAGGINMDSAGAASLSNSIVATNAPIDCSASSMQLSQGHNLDGDGTCRLLAASDLSGTDPLLGALGDNGGPSATHALLPGSPAINAAPNSTLLADQRGFPRVGSPDIGAFEFQGPFAVDNDGDGFDSIATGGTDCDDTNLNVFPGALETPYDGIDQDCDGKDLNDVDGDGFPANQAAQGTPDCDDTNPDVFPGATDIPDDGIDQDCDGADAIGEELEPEPEPPPAGISVQVILLAGWNTLVWGGAADADPADLAFRIGQRVDSIWAFGEGLQAWEVHRPGGLEILNSLDVLAQGEAIFLRLTPGEPIAVDLPDVLPMEPREVVLVPAWNFVGYTGAASLIAPLLPGGVGVAFRYDRTAQGWDGFLPSGPAFVNAFVSVDRLVALFVRNDSGGTLTLVWEQQETVAP